MQSPGQLPSQVVGYDLTSHLVFALSASETQATLLPPPPTPPQIHAPKFNISLQKLPFNRQQGGREAEGKWRKGTKTEVQAEPQSILPYLQPLPQQVSIWEESSAYNTVDGRLLPRHWALTPLCSPQPPSETTSVLPGLPISSITVHA